MTYKEKVNSYLRILNINPDHEITRKELKANYLELIKEHPVDTDSKKYYEIKDAYDYLYDNIEMIEEALNELDIVEEVTLPNVEPKEIEEPVVVPPMSDVKVKDRPTLFAILFSILSPIMGIVMFFMLRKVTPKSSWLYLVLGLLSFALSVWVFFFLPM